MSYLQLHDTFLTDAKVAKVAKTLGCSKVCARGLLVTLWLNVLTHRADGVLSGWDAESLAIYLEWEGDAEKLIEALERAKLLDLVDDVDARWAIHNWAERCNLKHKAKSREQARVRQQRKRDKSKPVVRDDLDVTRDVTMSRTERRGEDLRSKNERSGPAQPPALTKNKHITLAATPPPPPRSTASVALAARSSVPMPSSEFAPVATLEQWEVFVANTLHQRQVAAKFLPLLRGLLPLSADELRCGWQQTLEMGGRPSAAMLLRKIEIIRREPPAEALPGGQAVGFVASRVDKAIKNSVLVSRQFDLRELEK